MNAIPFVLSALMVALVAVVLLITPAVVQPTLPLGVSVPADRAHEPVVRVAVRRFRLGVVAALVLSLLVAVLLAAIAPVAGTIVPVIVMLLLGYTAYATSRARIRRAKRDEGWYDNVPVRISADVTPAGASRPPIAPAWYLVSLVIIAVIAAVGVALYPTLPDPLPIHWNAAGHIDGYADKSIWSVFGPLLIGAALVVLLFLIALWVRATPPRVRAGGSPTVVEARTRVQLHLTQALLGQLSVLLALVMSAVSLAAWLAPGDSAAALLTTVGMIVLLVVLVLLYLVRYLREVKAITDAVPRDDPPASAPDDDRFWKLGVFYVNRDDPATMVPKRFGVGWTINLGSAGGMAIGIVVGLLVIGGIVAGFVVPGHHVG